MTVSLPPRPQEGPGEYAEITGLATEFISRMFEFERAVLSGREVEGLSLLGDNDGRLHERLDELQRRTRESVWNMQPWLKFDPYDPYDELNARSRSVGHQVRLILPPSGLTRNPLISSKYPIVRIGPVPLPLMVIDGSVIVYEGSRAPNSNMTVWVLTRPDWVAPALAMWSAAWEVSRPALDDPSRPPLSARQYAVACFLARGLGDDAIARKVGVSRRTVASDVRVVMDLVGAQTRFQAGTRLGSMAYTVDRS